MQDNAGHFRRVDLLALTGDLFNLIEYVIYDTIAVHGNCGLTVPTVNGQLRPVALRGSTADADRIARLLRFKDDQLTRRRQCLRVQICRPVVALEWLKLVSGLQESSLGLEKREYCRRRMHPVAATGFSESRASSRAAFT